MDLEKVILLQRLIAYVRARSRLAFSVTRGSRMRPLFEFWGAFLSIKWYGTWFSDSEKDGFRLLYPMYEVEASNNCSESVGH
jgi:hypothetical protein